MQFRPLWAKPQPRMPLDHLKTRTPGNNPKLIGDDSLWAKDRSETLLDRSRRDEEPQTDCERGRENQPAPPEPYKIENRHGCGDPYPTRLSKHHSQSDQPATYQPYPQAFPYARRKKQKR